MTFSTWLATCVSSVDYRLKFLQHDRILPLHTRAFKAAFGRGLDPQRLLRERLRTDAQGRRYFALQAGAIYIDAAHRHSGQEESLRGAELILLEAFANPMDLLSGAVTCDAGDVVLDCGGNIGTTALYFSRLIGGTGHVHVFEPIFHRTLQLNVDVHRATNCTVVPAAVGDHDGTVQFNVTDWGIDSRMSQSSGGTQVPLRSIDRYVAEKGLGTVDLIKLDVEGAERLVLCGAKETLQRHRPKLTIASYHSDFETGQPQHPLLLRDLAELGYQTREVPGQHIYAWHEQPSRASRESTGSGARASMLALLHGSLSAAEFAAII